MKAFLLLTMGIVCLMGCTSIKTIQVPGYDDGNDTVLHGLSSKSDVNYGANPQLAADAWTFSKEPGIIRSLLRFDLSTIPPKATVTKATLSLYAWGKDIGLGKHASKTGSNEGLLQRVTSSWDENTVTWNTQPTTTSVNEVMLPASTSPDQNYVNIDVTALINDMRKNPSESFGFMLRLKTEEIYRILNFCSSDHEDHSKHPKLMVEYK
ncbi:MAG TPA: DNRLRE domain-containing protein [Cyclobacteriaceae bacterium]